MPKIVDIRKADDPRDVIHQAVHLLAQGELVAFPTETEYIVAANGLQPGAVRKLQQIANSAVKPPCLLVVKGAEEALDYVPHMTKLGRRLARRCWPGPVTIAFDVSTDKGLWNALPAETCDVVVLEGEVQLRAPAHEVVQEILKLMPAPLVAPGETCSDTPPVTTAATVAERLGDNIALIVDDGPCRYGEPATTVCVSDDEWKLVKPGVVSETTLVRLASEIYLFACTGNTCRSPMAEGLFRKLLSERLQCTQDGLFDRGFVAMSAGLAAATGAPASPESVDVAGKHGIDLSGHESRPLTDRLLDQADYVYTMTRDHRESILATRPDLSNRVELLSRDGEDIADPLGAGIGEYEKCERQIERHLRAILEEIEIK